MLREGGRRLQPGCCRLANIDPMPGVLTKVRHGQLGFWATNGGGGRNPVRRLVCSLLTSYSVQGRWARFIH